MEANMAAAYGVYSQDVALADIVSNLNQAGFHNEDICMMLSPAHPIASIIREAGLFGKDHDQDDSEASATTIGWLSAFGAVLIPSVGFFIRSRVFIQALIVTRETPSLRENARTLIGLGFSDNEAERLEAHLARLGVLVYVSCPETGKTLWASEVLRHAGAREAATLTEGKQRAIGATA